MGNELSEHVVELPRAGVRARRIARFERELARWLATDEGRFAVWCAARSVATEPDESRAS